MVLPGYLTTDVSSVRLRRSLNAAGYKAHGWELGRNVGARPELFDAVLARIEALHHRHGEPVALIGWSLGGVFAREASKQLPDKVSLVMTLGSPFSGDMRANNAWRIYELLNDHPVDRPPIPLTLSTKPPVRTIAVWSSKDGIVSPASARGLPEESDQQVEVNCRHLNYARSSVGIREIGRLLAENLA